MRLNVGILVLTLVCSCYFTEGSYQAALHRAWRDQLGDETLVATSKSSIDSSNPKTAPALSVAAEEITPTNTTVPPPSTNASVQPPSTNASMQPPSTNTTVPPPSTNASVQPPSTNASVQPPSTNASVQTSPSGVTEKPTSPVAPNTPTPSVQTTTIPPSGGIVNETYTLNDTVPVTVDVQVPDDRPYTLNITNEKGQTAMKGLTVNATMCKGTQENAERVNEASDGSYTVSEEQIKAMVKKFCTGRRIKRSSLHEMRFFVFGNDENKGESVHIAGAAGPAPPPTHQTPSATSTTAEGGGLATGWIVTIVLGILLLIILAVGTGVIICLVRKNRAGRDEDRQAIWRQESYENIPVPSKAKPTPVHDVYDSKPAPYHGGTSPGYHFDPRTANQSAGYGSVPPTQSMRPSPPQNLYQSAAGPSSHSQYGYASQTSQSLYPRINLQAAKNSHDNVRM